MSKSISNVKVCRSIWSQGTGLMFRFPKKPFAFVFPFNKSVSVAITMWFVFYPIDILFIDKNGIIVEIKSNLKPFRNYFPKQHFYTFIELPSGFSTSLKLKLGQSVSWSDDLVSFH